MASFGEDQTIVPNIWTFIDVETPNKRNDRICSIGIIKTSSTGEVIDKRYYLVDPEERFDETCMSIHGIAPIDVKGKPTFPEVWNDYLCDAVIGSGVVAHNAAFDLNVLCKALSAYGLVQPDIAYACTMRMAKAAKCGAKLNDICKQLNIPLLNHHNASNDVEACMSIFWTLVKNERTFPQLQQFDYRSTAPSRSSQKTKLSDLTIKMQNLKSILEAAIKDGQIETKEAIAVLDIIESSEQLRSDPTVSSLADLLEECAMDGCVDKDESRELLNAFMLIVDPIAKAVSSIEFGQKTFCLTGVFDRGTRPEIENYIREKGGVILKSVTKGCDYVVVGGQGSSDYAMGNYGTKVKKALDWQAKGMPVKIISESVLFGG